MSNNPLVFGKKNYQILIGAIVVIVIGFILMTLETGEYGFGTLGLTVGPMTVLAGFILVFWAILYKDSATK
jgi:uncharacterized membrane protein